MSEQIYVAVAKHEKFGKETTCGISYVGTLEQIVSSINNDDGYAVDYDFYTLGSDKLKLITEYSVEKA